MFYTINLSPLLVIKKGFMTKIILSNYQECTLPYKSYLNRSSRNKHIWLGGSLNGIFLDGNIFLEDSSFDEFCRINKLSNYKQSVYFLDDHTVVVSKVR